MSRGASHIGAGFSYGPSSGAMFFNMSRYAPSAYATGTTKTPADTEPVINLLTDATYIPWGNDNALPQQMIDDIENCGVLNGGIDGKVRAGLGRGVMPCLLKSRNPDGSEVLEMVMDPEIDDFLEESNIFDSSLAWNKDLVGLGQDLCRFQFDKAGDKIGILAHHPVAEMRYGPKNPTTGLLEKIKLSANWTITGAVSQDMIDERLLPKYSPAAFLQSLKPDQRKNKSFSMVVRQHSWNRHYYSLPLWVAAKNWVEISKNVPKMKAAMFENNIRVKYMVIVHEEYWTRTYPEYDSYDAAKKDALEKELWDEIDNFLTGSANAYKSIYLRGHTDIRLNERFADIEIKPVDDNTTNGELLPDSAVADAQVLFALMMNPALMGANSFGSSGGRGGAGSGSDIREAALVQVMIQEFERNSIAKKMGIISKVNGWKARYPQLVWRFPGMVLTTLDKGGSTAQVVNGSTAGK